MARPCCASASNRDSSCRVRWCRDTGALLTAAPLLATVPGGGGEVSPLAGSASMTRQPTWHCRRAARDCNPAACCNGVAAAAGALMLPRGNPAVSTISHLPGAEACGSVMVTEVESRVKPGMGPVSTRSYLRQPSEREKERCRGGGGEGKL